MAKSESWPKTEKRISGQPLKYCCACRKEIKDGEAYHYLRRRGIHYFHAACFEKELARHD